MCARIEEGKKRFRLCAMKGYRREEINKKKKGGGEVRIWGTYIYLHPIIIITQSKRRSIKQFLFFFQFHLLARV